MRKIALIVESVLVVLFGCAVFAVPVGKFEETIPYFSLTVTLITLLAIFFAVGGFIRSEMKPLSGIWVSALSLSAFIASDLSIAHSLPPLFILVVAVTAFTSKPHYWIGTAVLFLLGEPVRRQLSQVVTGGVFDPRLFVTSSLVEPWRYVYVITAGVLCSGFASSLHHRSTVIKPAILPQSLAAGSRSQDNDEPAQPEKTTEFSIDTSVEGVNDLLSSVVYFMHRNFRAYSSLGFIFDSSCNAFVLNSFQSKSIHIRKQASIVIGEGVIGRLGSEKRPFMTGDLRHYSAKLNYYREEEQINSMLAVPIISDDMLLGALVLDSKDTQAFKDQDKDIMRRFATLAAALISSERMRYEQEKSARVSQLFYQASHKYTTALKRDEVFNVLFSLIPGVVPCTRQISVEFVKGSNMGRVTGVSGAEAPDGITAGFEFPINAGGLYSFAFQKRKSLVIGDYQQYMDRYFRFFPQEAPGSAIRSLAIFPVMDDEQRCRGLYSVESNQPDLFTEDMRQILTTLVENASVAYVRAMLYQKMEKLATTDGLTELTNHRTFQELLGQEIERSRRYNRPLALLLMDIDHFKTFNDTYGHPVGDLVLKEIAECIRRSIRMNDIPARYGGEEFVVIIPETNERGAMITAERIRSTIEQHTVMSLDRELKVTVSLGCSAFPENAPSQQALIDTADKALYVAKKNGRNRAVPYKNGM